MNKINIDGISRILLFFLLTFVFTQSQAQCPTLFNVETTTNIACSGDPVTFLALLNPVDAQNGNIIVEYGSGNVLIPSLEGPNVSGLYSGSLVLENSGCYPVTQTYTIKLQCTDDNSISAVQTEDITIYPSSFEQFVSVSSDDCSATVEVSAECTDDDGVVHLTVDQNSFSADPGETGTWTANYSFIDKLGFNPCATPETTTGSLDIPYNCTDPCDNDAGTMGGQSFLCDGSFVIANSDGAVIGDGSTLIYVLHDGNDLAVGPNIYASAADGVFLNEGVPTNVTLCISAVVGDDLDANGVPTPSGCYDVSECLQAVFLDPIVISASEVCDPVAGTYTVNLMLTGGGPEFFPGHVYELDGDISGDLEPGSFGTYGPFNSGEPYSFQVIADGKGCSTDIYTSSATCEVIVDCDAGVLGGNAFVCEGEFALANATGVDLGADATQVYVLHNGSSSAIGLDVYATATDGIFTNDGNLPTNVTLCISSVVGNSLDANGVPSIDGSCYDISNCLPVVFLDPIQITSIEECDFDTGTYTVQVTINGGGPNFFAGHTYTLVGDFAGEVDAGSVTTLGPFDSNTSYSFSVSDDGKGCSTEVYTGTADCDVYDLALIKTVASPGPFFAGDDVLYTISVYNQGNIDANNIEITDYIPLGMSLSTNDNNGWTVSGSSATTTIPSIISGGTYILNILINISDTSTPGDYVNYAEISGDDGDDVDSTADNDSGNDAGGVPDSSTDNTVNGNGTDDEDDHDPASITVGETVVAGCTDPCAPNYNADAVVDDSSCEYYTTDCNSDCTQGDITIYDTATCACVVSVPTVLGCTDALANNYDPNANCDDGSCSNEIAGCTDPCASNYNAEATTDDGSCNDYSTTCNSDCTQGDITVYDTATCGCVVSTPTVLGCTDVAANNYDPNANCDDGSCSNEIAGCTDPCASNYNAEATTDDGSCNDYSTTCNSDCTQGDITVYDTATCGCVVSTPTILGCTDAAANNYDPAANCSDNATCTYDPVGDVFDLALIKGISTDFPGPFCPGDMVQFSIAVYNQGDINAINIEITDYIPEGLTLSDDPRNSIWSVNGSTATTIIPSLAAGAATGLSIWLIIDPDYTGSTIINYAEISEDNGNDIDSNPDNVLGNDAGGVPNSPTDNTIQGVKGGLDEDDHDPVQIEICDKPDENYDLALIKGISTDLPGPYCHGDDVRMSIAVYNQGDVDAFNIEITDYLPEGTSLSVNDNNGWMVNGNTATNIVSFIPAGGVVGLSIVITINPDFSGSFLLNYAEISADDGDDVDSTPDNDNTNDAGAIPNGTYPDEADPSGTDSTINGQNGDEDDHDVVIIDVCSTPTGDYDLALIKAISSSRPDTYCPGDDVRYNMAIYNQGGTEACFIEITEYIPEGMSVSDNPDNAGWSVNGSIATTTINECIPPGGIYPNDVANPLSIWLVIDADYSGPSTITNYAEISDDDGDDIDSFADSDPTNDMGGVPNSPTDNVINNEKGDEDDHDSHLINICDTPSENYDLALFKDISSTFSNENNDVYCPGDDVLFSIAVYNQGDIDANNIEITDYIPEGFMLSDNDTYGWVQNGSYATNIITFLAAGDATGISILLTIDSDHPGGFVANYAEISADDGDDIDSTPDNNPNNDAGGEFDGPFDNNINGNGTNDEDDHDPDQIFVDAQGCSPVFDLALVKEVAAGQPLSFIPGDDVTFTITVYNQGSVDAANVEIIDYVHGSLTLNDPDWNADGTYTFPGIIPVGGSVSVDITFTIDPSLVQSKSIVNTAEILSATDGNGNPVTDIDSTPDGINGNDAGGNVGSPSDNVIDGDGTGMPNGTNPATDEDDHDPAIIEVIAQLCDAGLLPSNLYVCAGTPLAVTASDVLIPPGFEFVYVLYSGDFDVYNIIEVSENGVFSTSDLSTNTAYTIQSLVGPEKPEPGEIVLPVFCDFSNEMTVVLLDPVVIDAQFECDNATSLYTVAFTVNGGLPSYDANETYAITGDFNTASGLPNNIYTFGPISNTTYTIQASDANGCGGNFSEDVECKKLPVELLDFVGEVQEDGNLVKWTTGTEIENSHFTLLVSKDGINYEVVEVINGAGTTSSTSDYSFLHRSATAGSSYYKLVQTDFDGTTENLGQIELIRGESAVSIVSILPIPALNNIELTFTTNSNTPVVFDIVDIIGQTMLEVENTNAEAGLNNISIDIANLPAGVYFIRMLNGEIVFSEKFIKE